MNQNFFIPLLVASIFACSVNAAAMAPVSPHFPSFWCQKKAAAIQNGAAVAIAAKDFALVSLRLVQSQAAFKAAKSELYGFAAATILMALSGNMWLVPACAGLVFVQVGNLYRNSQTYKECSNCLDGAGSFVPSLLQIGYEGWRDIGKLIEVLRAVRIDPGSILDYVPSSIKSPL